MIVTSLLAALVTAVLAAGAFAGTDNAGGVLAAYTVKSLDGDKTTLASYRGDIVVVNFWASWCAPCRHELPMMEQWNQSWQGRGARVVAISVDSDKRKARRFVDEENLALAVFHDGPDGLARELDIPSLPCTYLLDRNGNVLKVVQGSNDAELAALYQTVESMLADGRVREVQKAASALEGGR
jgi:thiol-disulfide isomerase/thioredoxin